MSQWQPIDTAPRNTWVLVWLGDASHDGVGILMLSELWQNPSQAVVAWHDGTGDSDQDYHPTHWMPMPHPPNA